MRRKDHVAFADHHTQMAKAHAMRAEAEEEGSPDHTFHKSAAALHIGAAEYHTSCAKTAEDELEKRDGLVPTAISAVTPDAPGPRAVLRYGQRPLESAPSPMVKTVLGLGTDEEE